MSNKHLTLLRSIFHDPIAANIHWRDVESLLHHLGFTVEPAHGARFRVVLNHIEGFLHHPHHSNELSKQDVKHLREVLAHAGVSIAAYEASQHKEQ